MPKIFEKATQPEIPKSPLQKKNTPTLHLHQGILKLHRGQGIQTLVKPQVLPDEKKWFTQRSFCSKDRGKNSPKKTGGVFFWGKDRFFFGKENSNILDAAVLVIDIS